MQPVAFLNEQRSGSDYVRPNFWGVERLQKWKYPWGEFMLLENNEFTSISSVRNAPESAPFLGQIPGRSNINLCNQ